MSDAEFQYLTGQARPGFPALFEEFERRSADAVRSGACELDLRQAPMPLERIEQSCTIRLSQ